MHEKPLFAFFGTPKFAVDVLNALERRGLLPALVVTAPDKPRGRGLELQPSPAKAWAL
jgi:methionyl-tRNA formyltransferase